MSMPGGEVVDPPHSLKPTEECSLDQVVNFATSFNDSTAIENRMSGVFLFWYENRSYIII